MATPLFLARATRRSVRTTAAALSLAVAAALGACAPVPDLGVRPVARTEPSDASALDGGAGQWPSDTWWERFGDPQLNALVDEALAGAPTLAVAQARLREASARADVSRADRLPSLDLSGSVTREKLSYNSIFPAAQTPHGWNDMGRVSASFNWELDFWGKNRKAFDAAVSQARASEADLAAARLMLTTNVVDAYLRLQLAFDRQDVAAETLHNRQASADLVTRRVAQGVDAQVSTEEAAARVHVAESDMGEASENVVLSRNALAALVGAGPDRGRRLSRPAAKASLAIDAPDTVSANLLGRKPEVVAARWRVEVAASRVGVAKTAFYPDINLKAVIGLESLGLGRLSDAGSDTGSVGPAFRLPLFEGGRLKANYRAAGAEYDAAVASYDEALTRALRDAADALGSLAAIGPRLVATDAALVRSREAYRLAKRRYEGGLSDYQSVLTAEDALLNVRVADTTLRIRGLSTNVALVRALGGGYQTPSPFPGVHHD